MRRALSPCRRGATLVESVVVYPVMFFLLLAILLGGLGVFHHEQVSWLSRDTARWSPSVAARSQWRPTSRPPAPRTSAPTSRRWE